MRQLITSLVLVLVAASNAAYALPGGLGGLGNAIKPVKRPSKSIDATFEDLIGRKISLTEEQQINGLLAETEEMQLKPQLVSTFGGTEIIPLICGQFKASFDWAKGIGGEVNPCFDPMSGKSFVMKGTSFNNPGSASAALMGGIYVGPASEQKPIVGQYGFVGLTKDLIPFVKFTGQISVDLPCLNEAIALSSQKTWEQTLQNCKFMAMGGLGISVSDLFKKFKDKLSKKPAGTAAVAIGGTKLNVGVTFEVKEFPWYERLKNGSSLRQAFADWQTYQAP